jgi:hypothetical protein
MMALPLPLFLIFPADIPFSQHDLRDIDAFPDKQ